MKYKTYIQIIFVGILAIGTYKLVAVKVTKILKSKSKVSKSDDAYQPKPSKIQHRKKQLANFRSKALESDYEYLPALPKTHRLPVKGSRDFIPLSSAGGRTRVAVANKNSVLASGSKFCQIKKGEVIQVEASVYNLYVAFTDLPCGKNGLDAGYVSILDFNITQ